MAETAESKHWWPNLMRFGARLSVAQNPSVGRNFLKLAVLDRELFASTSGIVKGGDLLRILRASGFTYVPSEARSKADQVYDAGVRQQLPIPLVEQASNEEKRKLYFYAPAARVSVASIQRVIPNFHEADVRQLARTDIWHLDHQYISGEEARSFIHRTQEIDDAELGIFYTIPRDREKGRAVSAVNVTANMLLHYANLPRGTVDRLAISAGPAAAFCAFESVPTVEDTFHIATLGLDGYALKAPRLAALAIAYPTLKAAITANGGHSLGVEREEFPWGLPLGIDYPAKRLLVLKDARFLEYNPLRLPDPKAITTGLVGYRAPA